MSLTGGNTTGNSGAPGALVVRLTASQRRAASIEVATNRALGLVSLVIVMVGGYYVFRTIANGSKFSDPVLGGFVDLANRYGWIACLVLGVVFVGTNLIVRRITRIPSIEVRSALRDAEDGPSVSVAIPLPTGEVLERLARVGRWAFGTIVVEGDGKKLVLRAAPRHAGRGVAIVEADAPTAYGGVSLVSACPSYRHSSWFPLLLLIVLLPGTASWHTAKPPIARNAPRVVHLSVLAGQGRIGAAELSGGFGKLREPARSQPLNGLPETAEPQHVTYVYSTLAGIAWGAWFLWGGRKTRLRRKLAAAVACLGEART